MKIACLSRRFSALPLFLAAICLYPIAVPQAEAAPPAKTKTGKKAVYPVQQSEHGEIQVEKMVRDLPAMSYFPTAGGGKKRIGKNSRIWRFVADGYGRKVNGSVTCWGGTNVPEPMEIWANHTVPGEGGMRGSIRIRSKLKDASGVVRDATSEELWSSVVFELFNIQNAEDFIRISVETANAKVTREDWIRRNTALEHKAVLRLAGFYRQIWEPWAKANGLVSHPFLWHVDTPADFDEWISSYPKEVMNPRMYWANYWDSFVVPYLQSRTR